MENDSNIYSLEIEKYILSSILIDPNILVEISNEISIDDFYSDVHKLIYKTILKCSNESINTKNILDPTILIDYLKRDNLLDKIGGTDYISELASFSSYTATIELHIDSLKKYSKKRKLLNLSKKINTDITTNLQDIDNIIDEAQTILNNIDMNNKEVGFYSISELIEQELKNVSDENNNIKIKSLTGFHKYDKLTSGLRGTDLLILAARPAVGKTALSLNIALNVAKQDKTVLIFSLEMGSEQLLRRLIASESQLSASEIEKKEFTRNPEKATRYSEALQKLSKLNILIDSSATSNINSIKNISRTVKLRYGVIDLIVIDYLQLISTNSKSGNREQEISEISRNLKLLAKELKVPILALSQLSRKVETREDKRPMLSDLRESGSIEQDADQVMFLYNSKYYDKNKHIEKEELEPIELILAKHRNGSIGNILLLFNKMQQKFLNPHIDVEKDYYSKIIND